MRRSIPAPEAETMRVLLRQLPGLVWEATNAGRVDDTDKALVGPRLEKFRHLESKLVKTVALIREIAEN